MKGPVIILGSVRTGSSLISKCLKNLGYQGHDEGHLFYLFRELEDTIDNYYKNNTYFCFDGTLFKDLPLEKIKQWYYESVRRLISTYYSSDLWVEKTVNAMSLKSIDTVFKIWPSAIGVYTIRRPIEVLRSRRIKFPKATFSEHLNEMKNIHQYWMKNKNLHQNIIEIEHYDVVNNGDLVVEKLSQHLDLDKNQSLKLGSMLQTNFVERSSENYSPISLKDLNLSSQEEKLFVAELDCIFTTYNYSYDSSYYKI